jgi:hypothetical protein
VVLRVKHATRHRELVQAHLPERVLAVGCVAAPRTRRTGTRWGPRTARIDPTAGAPRRGRPGDGPADPGFPPHAWLAVTGTRIYVFTARRGQVGDFAGAWDRPGTSVRTVPGLTSIRLDFSFGGSGPPVAVRARRWVAGNRQLVAYLLDPSRTT